MGAVEGLRYTRDGLRGRWGGGSLGGFEGGWFFKIGRHTS